MRTNVLVRPCLAILLFFGVPSLVYSQAANNTCGTAASLTPALGCTAASSATGNLQKATSASADLSISGSCGGATAATTFDVWYKFTASSASTGITISNMGSALTGSFTPYMEVLNGTCGSFSPAMSCTTLSAATTRIMLSGLSVGTTYYVRVYTTTQGTSNPKANWNFDICIQNPPSNDDCSGAISLTPNTSCSGTTGTVDIATATTGLPAGCESVGTHYDVWYSFVAANSTNTIS
ncbi:MAG: hypothetical protein ACXV2C_02895, partial [Candidatus Bathyarchaeia archaeon]